MYLVLVFKRQNVYCLYVRISDYIHCHCGLSSLIESVSCVDCLVTISNQGYECTLTKRHLPLPLPARNQPGLCVCA